MDSSPPGSSVHGDSPGKNTGVGCHALLQGIFSIQELSLCLLCLLQWQVGFVFFFTTSTTWEAPSLLQVTSNQISLSLSLSLF